MARREPAPIHPSGSVQAVCVDVIDLGERLKEFPGAQPSLQPTVALVFQTTKANPKSNHRFELSREFNVTMGKKATLRRFLGEWRGARITQKEADDGIQLADYCVGRNGLLVIEHRVAATSENTYAYISSVGPLLDGMPEIEALDYERAAFWDERIAEYAKAAAEFKAKNAPKPLSELLKEDDDLPF